ncbi:diguanylate cyclase domain-containing protein [Aliivibrio logei]|uniref:diguanylate cyclase domain-containing protein n=1 Tax=Aliivibrio logei TaxID=688 RepID=UPI0003A86E00|nr:diguanylate cyclase [Aliivibrio logei]
MKWIEGASLRQKLSFPIIAFTMILFVVFQGYHYVNTYNIQKDNLINRIKVLGNGVGVNLQSALRLNDDIAATKVLHAFSADSEILQVLLLKNDGTSFAEYRKNNQVAQAPNKELQRRLSVDGFAIGDHSVYLFMPVLLNNEKIASIRLIASKDELNRTRDEALNISFTMFGLIIVCGYLFIVKIQQWIITPVTNLNKAMQGIINRGEFTVRPCVTIHDEVGDLTLSFNKMADRLEERQKQLSFVLNKVEQERDFGEQIITAVQHGLFAVDRQGKILLSNDASKRLFSTITYHHLVDQYFLEIVKPVESKTLLTIIENCTEVDDVLIQTTSGSALQITTRILTNKNELLFSIIDVTEAIKSRTQQKLAANVFKNSQDGILIFDVKGSLTLMNPAFTEMFGYEMRELSDLSMKVLFDSYLFTTLTNLIIESLYKFGQWHGEVLETNKFGVKLPLYIKACKILDDEQNDQESYIFIFTNLSDIKEKERLDHLAHHDLLTGLPNRSKFYNEANQSLIIDGDVGLCYLDLDGFKHINDTYGHDAGDEVLRVIAKRLENMVRAKDIACRLAGDEFVLFINPVIDKNQLIELADKVITSIQLPIYHQGTILFVGASIGITIATYQENRNLDKLLKESDRAMYEAKLSGKGRYAFHIM